MQSVPMKGWMTEGEGVGGIAHDGDTVSAGTSVPLEDDVAAFIDRETVVLVLDRALNPHWEKSVKRLGYIFLRGCTVKRRTYPR